MFCYVLLSAQVENGYITDCASEKWINICLFMKKKPVKESVIKLAL